MSADSWMICPKCAINHKIAVEKHRREVEDAYGEKTLEEWLIMKEMAEPPNPVETFAEYYEIGITEMNEFYARYSAKCTECDFGYEFRHDAIVEIQ